MYHFVDGPMNIGPSSATECWWAWTTDWSTSPMKSPKALNHDISSLFFTSRLFIINLCSAYPLKLVSRKSSDPTLLHRLSSRKISRKMGECERNFPIEHQAFSLLSLWKLLFQRSPRECSHAVSSPGWSPFLSQANMFIRKFE